MAKMAFSPQERPRVKLECLRLLTTLRLDPAKTQLISGFIDTYLRLEKKEEESFQKQIKSLGLVKEELVMEIVTSWMEKGIEQGLQQGLQREIALVLRLLHRRVGSISPELQAQVEGLSLEKIEALGEALLDFHTEGDLVAWLNS